MRGKTPTTSLKLLTTTSVLALLLTGTPFKIDVDFDGPGMVASNFAHGDDGGEGGEGGGGDGGEGDGGEGGGGTGSSGGSGGEGGESGESGDD